MYLLIVYIFINICIRKEREVNTLKSGQIVVSFFVLISEDLFLAEDLYMYFSLFPLKFYNNSFIRLFIE